MVQKFLTLAIFMIITNFFPSFVLAEQATAEHYRQLINSGKFFIEYSFTVDVTLPENYDLQGVKKSHLVCKKIAYDNEKKISYLGHITGTELSYSPQVLYENDKWYQFKARTNEAIVGEEKYFEADFTNPDENWRDVKSNLMLPSFLGALLPNNSDIFDFSRNSIIFQQTVKRVSTFIESGTEKLGKQTFNYDKYKVTKFDSAGNELKKITDAKTKMIKDSDLSETYTFYYDENGELKFVKEEGITAKMTTVRGYIYVRIKKFTGDIPTGFFNFPKGCKVYRMDMGTLADLLEVPELAEQY